MLDRQSSTMSCKQVVFIFKKIDNIQNDFQFRNVELQKYSVEILFKMSKNIKKYQSRKPTVSGIQFRRNERLRMHLSRDMNDSNLVDFPKIQFLDPKIHDFGRHARGGDPLITSWGWGV